MKAGDLVDCPRCGVNAFVLKESVLDGWTKTGEVLKCAACGAVLETIGPEKAKETPDHGACDAKAAAASRNSLLDLLGEPDLPPSAPPGFLDDKVPFCRDCAHLVVNAFRQYCAKYDKDVNPMDDCPSFQSKQPQGGSKK